MRISRFARCGLITYAAVSMLAGCAGHAGAGAVPSVSGALIDPPHHRRFSYTGHTKRSKYRAA